MGNGRLRSNVLQHFEPFELSSSWISSVRSNEAESLNHSSHVYGARIKRRDQWGSKLMLERFACAQPKS
jgi:hypothetical protein